MLPTTQLDLFAGIPVADRAAARTWYERLLGSPPAFLPHETEAVWMLADHRYLYIVEAPDHAGHARQTVFVEGLDALLAAIGARGLQPAQSETYENGVRKVTYRDPDGNEVSFGGAAP
ncbi:MAG TPA: VOC family protein [Thermoplasmata archaeon]|nr:VOC family protein [Thermoplasmata archaeon]